MKSDNIATRLQDNTSRYPGRAAIIYPGRNRSWEIITYKQLNERSHILALGLAALGLKPGMRAVLMTPPSIDFFALVFALLQTGVIPVMIDPAIGLRNVTACLVVAHPEVFFGSKLTHGIRCLFGWGKKSLLLNLSIENVIRAGESAAEISFPGQLPESEAAIIYTSGSTGLPKGVMFSLANLAAQVDMLSRTLHLSGNEIDLPAFPLFALIDCLLGVTAVIPQMHFPRPARVDPAKMVAAIQAHQVDTMFVSPAALDRLARYGQKYQITLPSLKQVITAGAPAPVTVQEMFRQMLADKANLYGIYGSTETLPVSIVDSLEVLNETRYLTERGAGICIGRAVDGAEVRIIPIGNEPIQKWDETLILPVGKIGEITVEGPAVTNTYIGQEKANLLAKIKGEDGKVIHRMGDVGYFDEKGRLWYCGRKSHMVVTTTGTLFTEAIEGIFNAHPLVFRTALIGVAKPGTLRLAQNDQGTEPVLWVELIHSARNADQNKIRAELLQVAQDHQATQEIRTVLFHHSFPTDVRHNSKIIREKLAALAQSRLR